LLLGRRIYDIFAAYWPYVEGASTEMGKAFTRAGKHVLTRGDQPLDWKTATVSAVSPTLLRSSRAMALTSLSRAPAPSTQAC
jgi:hypothetical protein